MSNKCQLILRNLSKRTTAKQLQQYASRFGAVADCYLTDVDGEAFLEFDDRLSVDVFMNKRPHLIDGNELQCQRRLPSFELQKAVKRIFLRGTVQQLTETRLRDYFEKYGPVLSCTIPKGKRNNTFTHFGYAFVAFDDEDVVDRIIQDKPHYIEEMELEIQKAEDPTRTRRRSSSPSPSSHSSRSSSRPVVQVKRLRRESLSPPPPPILVKRPMVDFPFRQIEEENRRLREHALMMRTHFDEEIWKLRRELDDERRRYDELKSDFEHLRRDYARLNSELQAKSSIRHHIPKQVSSSRH